jgi:hypothetical protein
LVKPYLLLCLAATACGTLLSPIIGDRRTPDDHANEVMPKCRNVSEELTSQLLAPTAIERVEPETAVVPSGNDRRANLAGAHISLRPTPGQSAEVMTRAFECHQARATLGQIEAQADDPLVLPGHWLDIDARSDGDGFSVRVTIDNIDYAKLILARAQRYAATAPHRI